MNFPDVLKTGAVSVAFQFNTYLNIYTAIALSNRKVPSAILERLNREPIEYSWHADLIRTWFKHSWFPYVEGEDIRACLDKLTIKMAYVQKDNIWSYFDIVDKHTTAYLNDQNRRLSPEEMVDTMQKAIKQYGSKKS